MAEVHWERLLEPQVIIFSVFALFYLFVLLMLITSRQKLMRGSYYVIFIFIGCSDLILFFADQYFRASGRLGLGPDFNILYIIASTLTGILYTLHVFGNFLATLCQFMAVCWPGTYNRLWSSQLTLVYLIFATILATSPQIPGLFMKNVYIKLNDSSYYLYTDEIETAGFIFSAVTVLLYVFIAPCLVWRTLFSLKHMGVGSKQLKRHYQSLAIITLVDCLFFLVDLVYEIDLLIWFIFDIEIYPNWVIELLGDPFDVYYSIVYISNPLILLLFSRISRREILRYVVKEKPTVISVTTVNPTQQTANRRPSKISTASTLF